MENITIEELRHYEPKESEPDIVHVSALFDEFLEGYKKGSFAKDGERTVTWPLFNESFGGFRPGVMVLTGETGQGKTTFGLNCLLQLAAKQVPVLLISLEMRWKDMVKKLAHYLVEKDPRDFNDQDVGVFKDLLDNMPMVILRHYGPLSSDLALKCISFASERFGVKASLLDHLDYVQKPSKHWQNEAYVIGDFMRLLASTSYKADQCVILIAHPSKLELKGAKQREVGMDELKGSSSIKQESDSVFSIFQPDDNSTEMLLRCQKMRADGYSRNVLGKVRFNFDPSKLRFNEVSTQLEWDV
jgi:replicative DNA helicase